MKCRTNPVCASLRVCVRAPVFVGPCLWGVTFGYVQRKPDQSELGSDERRGWRWDLSHIPGISVFFILFFFPWREKKKKKTHTHCSFNRNTNHDTNNYRDAHAHKATSQSEKTIKQLSEEHAQRIGSRIVLCCAVVNGVCFCCFIKAVFEKKKRKKVGSG